MSGRRGPFAVDPDQALSAIRLEWGDVYDTGFADGKYWAVRLVDGAPLLPAETPDELARAIKADWGTR
ncbi:MAG: hypothetical protein ACRDP5_10795 [Streptosporangiaceae bacterium]